MQPHAVPPRDHATSTNRLPSSLARREASHAPKRAIGRATDRLVAIGDGPAGEPDAPARDGLRLAGSA